MVLTQLPRIPPKDIAVFLDVDIAFLGRFGDVIAAEMADVDLAFMNESTLDVPALVNFGFFAARNSPGVMQFLRNVRDGIRPERHDQAVCQELLPTCKVRWKKLPLAFANTNTLNRDDGRRAVLFHAINTAPSRGRTSLQLKTRLLSDVLARRLSREVVVARHTEDPAWLSKLQLPYIVYDKSPTTLCGAVPLRNVGREANTYLEHICRHYGDLAKETCFVQGRPFDHVQNFGSEVAKPCDGFLEFNSLELECSPEYTEFDGATPLSSAWRCLFPGVAPPEKFRFRAGAQFAVTRDRILSRPLAFYEQALALSRWTWGPWLLERMWPYIFGLWPETSACASYSRRTQALEKLVPALTSTSEDIHRQKLHLDTPALYKPGSPRSIFAILGAIYEECQERPDLQRLVLEATGLALHIEAAHVNKANTDVNKVDV
jgi:hypothetical protein